MPDEQRPRRITLEQLMSLEFRRALADDGPGWLSAPTWMRGQRDVPVVRAQPEQVTRVTAPEAPEWLSQPTWVRELNTFLDNTTATPLPSTAERVAAQTAQRLASQVVTHQNGGDGVQWAWLPEQWWDDAIIEPQNPRRVVQQALNEVRRQACVSRWLRIWDGPHGGDMRRVKLQWQVLGEPEAWAYVIGTYDARAERGLPMSVRAWSLALRADHPLAGMDPQTDCLCLLEPEAVFPHDCGEWTVRARLERSKLLLPFERMSGQWQRQPLDVMAEGFSDWRRAGFSWPEGEEDGVWTLSMRSQMPVGSDSAMLQLDLLARELDRVAQAGRHLRQVAPARHLLLEGRDLGEMQPPPPAASLRRERRL